jgi:hypothetical protein
VNKLAGNKKEMKICSKCGAYVKIENYPRHMRNVHGITPKGEEYEKYEAVKHASQGQMMRREERLAKRRMLLAQEKRNKTINMLTACVIIAGLVGATFLIYYGISGGDSSGSFEPATATTAETLFSGSPLEKSNATNSNNSSTSGNSSGAPVENVIKIPVSSVSTTAKWYAYNSNGTNVRYFLVKGGDNKIHLATDACDVCYSQKKGYRQLNSNTMKCNNCGREFGINSIGTENTAGGCWPSYLPMNVQGDYVIIKTSDLNGKRFMFA